MTSLADPEAIRLDRIRTAKDAWLLLRPEQFTDEERVLVERLCRLFPCVEMTR
jgi:hypothetical protein